MPDRCSSEIRSTHYFHNLTESILQKIQEAGFEVAFEKELVLTKEQAEEFYKEHEDKEYFDSLTNHMSRYACWMWSISHN